jgi:hypothetical protein
MALRLVQNPKASEQPENKTVPNTVLYRHIRHRKKLENKGLRHTWRNHQFLPSRGLIRVVSVRMATMSLDSWGKR